jgi:dihydroorotate dehydrogenase electron transfer subunit
VGGGAGIAPLLHLSKVLKGRGVNCTILLGGRTAELIPVRDEFAPYGRVCIATDDGSLGHKGLVVEHPAFGESYDMIYTCGPTPMMKAVARSAAQRGIHCEVSLENMMACGVGACLCCVTDTDNGHRCVCKDGPVFDITTMKKWYE